MDRHTEESCSQIKEAEDAHPVRCTEEELLHFFADVSLLAVMDAPLTSTPPIAAPALQELRLVLLGRKGAGKSAAGNTILGAAGGFESGKPTEECVKRRADVAGRKVTVVDTPGWEWYYPLNGTPDWVRRETLRSISLCPPGPHAVLLVVRSCASIPDNYFQEIEQHLAPLGAGVWEHTLVLFTRGDELGLGTMEQRITASGSGLQKLLQKCDGRYHVVNNRWRDGMQAVMLVRKLEEMVAARTGRDGHDYLGLGNVVLMGLEADGRRRARERRKKQRQMEAQVQRGTIRAALTNDGPQGSELDAHQSFSKAPRRLPEVRLVLLGERETGKSSAGNAILGGAGFFRAASVTEECVRQQAEVAQRLVTVVDTPGWEAGVAGGTPERVKREIACSVALCPPGPHALLLTLRADTLTSAGHVREHVELLGEGAWRHALLLFTHTDQLWDGVDIQQHIQSGGRDLQGLLEKCRGRYHVLSGSDKNGKGDCVNELLEKVEKMATRNRCEAFHGLVQEVRDLSQQRNERFHQRLKEATEKTLRQEAELKKMREREVKSIRWFFDRRKKGKSPGKVDVQRENGEDEERRVSGVSGDFGELEERMRWLTDDREREIQDLSVEQERARAALEESERGKQAAVLRLEGREREVEELRERTEEQQLKLLDLERICTELERKRKQRENATTAEKDEWRKQRHKLEDIIKTINAEKAEAIEELEFLKTEMKLETKTLKKQEHEMVEKEKECRREMEKRLSEQKEQQEDEKNKWLEKKRSIMDEAKGEIDELKRQLEQMSLAHQETMKQVQTLKQQHQEEMLRERAELEESARQQANEKNQTEIATAMEEIRQNHTSELEHLRHGHQEEVTLLREHISRHQEELTDAKKRELAAVEKCLAKIKAQSVQNDQDKEELLLKHEARLEELLREKDEEMAVWKTKQREETAQKEEVMRRLEASKLQLQQEVEQVTRGRREAVARVGELEIQLRRETQERRMEKESYEKEAREREEMMRRVEEMKEKLRVGEEKERELWSTNRDMARVVEDMKAKMEEAEKKLQEVKERECALVEEKRDVERRCEEQERKAEEIEERLMNLQDELQRIKQEKDEVMGRQSEEAGQRVSDMEKKLQRRDGEMESLRQQAALQEARWREEKKRMEEKEMNEISNLMEVVAQKSAEVTQTLSLLERKNAEVVEAEELCASYRAELEKLRESYNTRAAKKEEELDESKKEAVQLRLTIEQTKTELKELTARMDGEMTRLIREYEREIDEKNREIREKDATVSQLVEERQNTTERLEESQRGLEELKEQNEKSRKEAENARRRWEELQQRREDEIQVEMRAHQERLENMEAIVRDRESEIKALKEQVDALKVEMELMKVIDGERREEISKLKEEQMDKGGNENDKERRQALGEKELILMQQEEELNKREEELAKAEQIMASREKELAEKELGLTRELVKKEQELEALLSALEGRQMELSSHGLALRDKAEGLKHHGRELKDRECHLMSEERELLGWKSELQLQGERVSGTTQQLEEMQRELASLREELNSKERNLKRAFRKMGEWERNLKRREEELLRRSENQRGPMSLLERDAENNDHMVSNEIEERKRRDSNEVPLTAVERKNSRHQTPEEPETLELQASNRKLVPDVRLGSRALPRNNNASKLDLNVLLLGETWSSKSVSGVTLLTGEASSSHTSRPWAGQIAGRHLTVRELRGLRWRDGPNATNASQRKSIQEDFSACGPDVVLLLVPAFLTCTRKYRRAVEELMSSLGQDMWTRTLVVFTWGELLGENTEQHILRNGELMALVEKCGGGHHTLTSKRDKSGIEALFEKIDKMVALSESKWV